MTTIHVTLASPTSTRRSTTVIFSVYATDAVDANSQFDDITSDIPIPSAYTAPGFTDVVTASATSSTAAGIGAGAGAGGSVPTASSSLSGGSAGGVASEAPKRQSGFGVMLWGCCLGLGIGLLAVLL